MVTPTIPLPLLMIPFVAPAVVVLPAPVIVSVSLPPLDPMLPLRVSVPAVLLFVQVSLPLSSSAKELPNVSLPSVAATVMPPVPMVSDWPLLAPNVNCAWVGVERDAKRGDAAAIQRYRAARAAGNAEVGGDDAIVHRRGPALIGRAVGPIGVARVPKSAAVRRAGAGLTVIPVKRLGMGRAHGGQRQQDRGCRGERHDGRA